jgi:hypothetical protein
MAKKEPAPILYPCMIQKDGIWRAHEPGDERPKPPSALRRFVTKLSAR